MSFQHGNQIHIVFFQSSGNRDERTVFEIRGTEANDRLEAERRELEANITLPSFIGKTLTEAASEITAMGLRYLTSGEGRVVTAQLGTPGTMVFSGDTVLLIMD